MDGAVFALALLAFAGLGADVVLRRRGRAVRPLTLGVAALALAHVAGVWAVRFGLSWTRATQGRWAGFLVFHAALVLLFVATVTPPPWSRRLLGLAFVAVSAGALGGVFRYEVVAGLRLPTIAIVILTVLGAALPRSTRRGRRTLARRTSR